MGFKEILPSEIEKESFRIIRKELAEAGKVIPKDVEPTVVRVIHTTADFEYADTLEFSEGVIQKAKSAIRSGAHIVTDTNMALAGINKKTLAGYGGEVHCFMADEEVAKLAKERGVTRAYVSMEKAIEINAPLIFAIGNAPTALASLNRLWQEKGFRPELIIAVPVGFVNVVEGKDLIRNMDVPYIINAGRKGGSGVAAAICNSILYNMESQGSQGSQRGRFSLTPQEESERTVPVDSLDSPKLRAGFTTGSCAAAAAKAALLMLIEGTDISQVSIVTPKGITYIAEIVDIERTKASVSCCVIKDGGDDIDATSGMKIRASVSLRDDGEILIDGGDGIGRITKPGLDQPIGEAAINSVPRKMIRENIEEVLVANNDLSHGATVIISAPDGEMIAQKTFNPKLGIVGGISILGTTGIVEPMSDEGILGTIKAQINMQKALGKKVLLVAPGNYGLKFITDEYQIDEDRAVLCSNFVYDTLMMALNAGFEKLLFVGHLGKLVKVAGGIKNTHSKYGDHRMEILSDAVSKFASGERFAQIKSQLDECVMTDEALRIIDEFGYKEKVFCHIAESIKENMESWAEGKITCETIIFADGYSLLSESSCAKDMLFEIKGED